LSIGGVCSGLIEMDALIKDNTVTYWGYHESKTYYKSYPQEFKEEAVALVVDQGYTVTEAAQSLCIRPNQLYEWKKKIEDAQLLFPNILS
jgi:hypothetical protein